MLLLLASELSPVSTGPSWLLHHRAVDKHENDQGSFPLNHLHLFLPPPDVNHLVKFLKEIPGGALVLVASYDDPGTK